MRLGRQPGGLDSQRLTRKEELDAAPEAAVGIITKAQTFG